MTPSAPVGRLLARTMIFDVADPIAGPDTTVSGMDTDEYDAGSPRESSTRTVTGTRGNWTSTTVAAGTFWVPSWVTRYFSGNPPTPPASTVNRYPLFGRTSTRYVPFPAVTADPPSSGWLPDPSV